MKQILHLLIYLLIGSFIFSQECEECVCEEPENVWFKVSYNENHSEYRNKRLFSFFRLVG